MNGKLKRIFLCFSLLLAIACGDKNKTGNATLAFTFSVDGEVLQRYQPLYVNAAGNHYEVDEVKYFISDVVFYASGNRRTIIDQKTHYVDAGIANTLTWAIPDPMPVGQYDSIRFVFGLSAERNISHAFVNPPEVNMAWPETLGGGYHYLQINGKWESPEGISPFNFHTGIGKTTGADSISRFTHHYFSVSLPLQGWTLEEKKTSTLTLDMNLNSWFTSPVDFDFNEWGGSIMENPDAQAIAQQNGADVFSVK